MHILLGMQPDLALSDLVREVKNSSTNFINEKRWIKGHFNWQSGFGAFSYSRSDLDRVIRYIQNQDKHHAKRSFKTEYLTFLRKFDIVFDEKYVFEFDD